MLISPEFGGRPALEIVGALAGDAYVLQRLMEFLTALGAEVEVTVRPVGRGTGRYFSGSSVTLRRSMANGGDVQMR